MKIKNTLKTGDILYRVDPKKLSVKVFTINHLNEKLEHSETTTHENFAIEKKEQKLFQMAIDKFPFEFKGLLYFQSEDEANHYLKMKIGM